MLTEEQGIEAIIRLQKSAGVIETEEQARAGWRGMSDSEKQTTEMAFRAIYGEFKGGEDARS